MDCSGYLQKILRKLEGFEEKCARIQILEEKVEQVLSNIEFLRSMYRFKVDPMEAYNSKRKQFQRNGRFFKTKSTVEHIHENVSDVHTKVLKKNHRHLVDGISVHGSIIDSLLEQDAIYPSDQENIMLCATRKDKIRSLILALNQYGEENFLTFVNALKEENPDLANRLEDDFQQKKSENNLNENTCMLCTIRNHIDIKDIVDDLYSVGIVDDSFLDRSIHSTRQARKHMWTEVFLQMRRSQQKSHFFEYIKSVMTRKYRSIFSPLSVMELDENCLKCNCPGYPSSLFCASDFEGTYSSESHLSERGLISSTDLHTPNENHKLKVSSSSRAKSRLRRKRRPKNKIIKLSLNSVKFNTYTSKPRQVSREFSSTDLNISFNKSIDINTDEKNTSKKNRGNNLCVVQPTIGNSRFASAELSSHETSFEAQCEGQKNGCDIAEENRSQIENENMQRTEDTGDNTTAYQISQTSINNITGPKIFVSPTI